MSRRKHIVDTVKRLYESRFISIRDGNVSFKPKNEPFFYISAGQVKKNEINTDQVVKVHFHKTEDLITKDLRGQYDLVFENSGPYVPSREVYMHSHLQTLPENYGKDIFVVHAHPPNIIAYTGIQQHNELYNIKLSFPELNVGKIGANVKYHDAGSYELANNCFKNLKDNDIVALERHGSLSVGVDIDKIFEDIETLEYYIGIELKASK
jgi:ribulose-5-phosphate 4-epimerase/fuculose-1-phosphate aldolase